jgi:hypothetical protein
VPCSHSGVSKTSTRFIAGVLLAISAAAGVVPISKTSYAGTVTPTLIEKTGTITTYDLYSLRSGRGACIKLTNFSDYLCNYNVLSTGGNPLYQEINNFTMQAYLYQKTCTVGYDSNISETQVHPIYISIASDAKGRRDVCLPPPFCSIWREQNRQPLRRSRWNGPNSTTSADLS